MAISDPRNDVIDAANHSSPFQYFRADSIWLILVTNAIHSESLICRVPLHLAKHSDKSSKNQHQHNQNDHNKRPTK